MVNFLAALELPPAAIYPHLLVASVDSHFKVSRRGDELFKKKAAGANLEDAPLMRKLFSIFQGRPPAGEHFSWVHDAPNAGLQVLCFLHPPPTISSTPRAGPTFSVESLCPSVPQLMSPPSLEENVSDFQTFNSISASKREIPSTGKHLPLCSLRARHSSNISLGPSPQNPWMHMLDRQLIST
jgi:hypothetical protein